MTARSTRPCPPPRPLRTAQECTDGWQRASASGGSPAEHAYLLEMRDRSGFDTTGRDESDRGEPTFAPGVYLAYTDENHGYGNVGTDNPPAQSPLDARPEPGSDTPNLDDAAFKQGQSFSDAGAGHVDNYSDARASDGVWRFDFDCLGFDVASLAGTGIGPEAPGTYDLLGDVTFRTGPGCAAFNYGWGEGERRADPPRPRLPGHVRAPPQCGAAARRAGARADRRSAPRPRRAAGAVGAVNRRIPTVISPTRPWGRSCTQWSFATVAGLNCASISPRARRSPSPRRSRSAHGGGRRARRRP